MDNHLPYNFRSSSYFLAEARRPCWRCGALCRVFAIILPAGHEQFGKRQLDLMEALGLSAELVLNIHDNPIWEIVHKPARLCYMRRLSQPATEKISVLAPSYSYGLSQTVGEEYYLNHCTCCSATQGDHYMHFQIRAPFAPLHAEDAAKIILYRVEEPIEAQAVWGLEFDFFDDMKSVQAADFSPHG